MRHGNKVIKLGRTKSHRKATLNNLFCALILNESIKTTKGKARALKRFVDKEIARAIKGDLNTRRKLKSELGSSKAYYKLFETIVPQCKDRSGGYVRVVDLSTGRRGDGTVESIVEFV
ncbi:50S ribosomal protein L17 [candidate division WOR-3 bacterium]|nr:50S ribosomal protein L17 [candidate division WOR-3 bacterium]